MPPPVTKEPPPVTKEAPSATKVCSPRETILVAPHMLVLMCLSIESSNKTAMEEAMETYLNNFRIFYHDNISN